VDYTLDSSPTVSAEAIAAIAAFVEKRAALEGKQAATAPFNAYKALEVAGRGRSLGFG
jgi:hypothetical protein